MLIRLRLPSHEHRENITRALVSRSQSGVSGLIVSRTANGTPSLYGSEGCPTNIPEKYVAALYVVSYVANDPSCQNTSTYLSSRSEIVFILN